MQHRTLCVTGKKRGTAEADKGVAARRSRSGFALKRSLVAKHTPCRAGQTQSLLCIPFEDAQRCSSLWRTLVNPLPVSIEDRRRLLLIFLGLLFFFSLVLVQFYKIQIVDGEKWTQKAQAQHRLVVVEPAQRGLFYANNSLQPGQRGQAQPFVVDLPYFHLFLDPLLIEEKFRAPVVSQLSLFLQLDQKGKAHLCKQIIKKSHSRRVALWLTKEKRDLIQVWWSSFARKNRIERNALYFTSDFKRSYPYGSMLGQVLHTVRDERDAKSRHNIPTGGMELLFNKVLHGKEGKRDLLRTPRNPLDLGEVVAPAQPGADVYLTINPYLQAVAEEELAKGVKKANARSGWIVLMEPRSGEIWALAQYPFFDPSRYAEFFNHPDKLQETKVKAITDAQEPGSIIKPLNLALYLKANVELKKRGEAPLFSPAEKIVAVPTRFAGRGKPVKDLRVHGTLNMYMGLQKSSNVYMSKLMHRVKERLGEAWYRQQMAEIFGLGGKTGVELPSESCGLLPTPGKKHANGSLEWSGGTPYALSMGHNLQVTGMQIARAYSIIANGGYDVKPTLVRKIVQRTSAGEERILLDHTRLDRIQGYKRLLEPEIVAEVTKAMKYVTKPGGTAVRADIPGYSEAGKTSTSEKIVNGQYSHKNHISFFVGFAPAKNPRFVLFVAIDEPEYKYIPGEGKNHHGGHCAAPLFREVGLKALHYLGVEPDDPCSIKGNPLYNREKADWYQEVKELKALYEQWNHK